MAEVAAAAAVAATAAALHLDRGNVDATTKLEVPVEGQPLLEGWEELIDEATGLSYYFSDTTNFTTWERPVVSEVVAAANHLDKGNEDATAKLEVVNSALVSPPLELEGKEAEEKGTEPDPEPDPEPELDPGGISETVAAYNAEEEVDPDGDTEDAAPVEVQPFPSGWEELID